MRAAVVVIGENGYEGASTRDMAARAGVSAAALFHHFPSKLDLLREFIEESYDVILARIDRRLADAGPTPPERLDEIVGTLIASTLHDEFAQLASTVAWREYTRLAPPARLLIEEKRAELRGLVEGVIEDGRATGEFAVADVGEAAWAITTLAMTLWEPNVANRMSMLDLIAVYQGFARSIAGGRGAQAGAAAASAKSR